MAKSGDYADEPPLFTKIRKGLVLADMKTRYPADGVAEAVIWRSKKVRRIVLLAFVPALLLFWFITAPASMAVQRIVSGGNGGPVACLICAATDWYESPMAFVGKVPALRRMSDSLADHWCELLGAPETTP